LDFIIGAEGFFFSCFELLLQAQKSLNYKAISFVIVVVISISCFVFDFFSVIAIGVEGFSFLFFLVGVNFCCTHKQV